MNNVPTATSMGTFVRVLAASGARPRWPAPVLTLPADLDDKVPEPMRTRLYLYFFMKFSCLDDVVDPGWCMCNDRRDAREGGVPAARRERGQGGARRGSRPTFPWILSRIVFVNAPFGCAPARHGHAAHAQGRRREDADPGLAREEKHAAALDAVVPRAALPAEPPWGGELREAWTPRCGRAWATPFEPEMDPRERRAATQ